MKFVRKDLKETKIEFVISLDAAELTSAEERALAKLAETTKVKGFRAGKAPLAMVKQNTDPNILAERTLDIAINQYLVQAFNEQKITPLDQPNVALEKFVPGEMLEFKAAFEILPKVKLPNYKNLKVKKESTKVTDAEVADTLERVRKSFATEQEVKRAAKLGDRTVLDFKGFKGDEAFAGGEGKDFPLELGSGQFIPGFEEAIVGHKPGEKFDINVTFPKNYGEKSLAGAKVKFEIKLHKVIELSLPEIDDELAKKTKMFQTLDELKTDIRKNLIISKEEAATEDFKNRLVEALAKNSKTSVPEVLKKDQLRALEQEFRQNLLYRGTTLEKWLEGAGKTYQVWVEAELEPAAETRVRAGLALAELAKELEITVTETEIDEQLEQLRTQYGKNDEAMKQLNNPQARRDVHSNLVTQKAIAKLVELNS